MDGIRAHMGMEKQYMARRYFGSFMIFLGFILILGSFGLTAYNVWDSNRAGEASGEVRDELVREIEASLRAKENADPAQGAETPGGAEGEKTEEAFIFQDAAGILSEKKVPEMDTYTVMIDGYPYIGVLDVPDLGLSLPVMADWDYERLRISPCRYTGTPYTDDLVVCGHNYARHFSPLKWVDIGADVYFTTSAGKQFHYIVSNRETIRPEAVEDMVENDRNSESTRDWDLTLFTCNTGGQTRCAVRCVRQEE